MSNFDNQIFRLSNVTWILDISYYHAWLDHQIFYYYHYIIRLWDISRILDVVQLTDFMGFSFDSTWHDQSSEMSCVIWGVMSVVSWMIWDVMCHWDVTSTPGRHLCEMQRAGDHGRPWTEASRTETSCGRVCPTDFSSVKSFTRSKTFKTNFAPRNGCISWQI